MCASERPNWNLTMKQREECLAASKEPSPSTDLLAQFNGLLEEVRLTLEECADLTDGDVCTLKRLRDAYELYANAPLHGRGTPRTVGEDVGTLKDVMKDLNERKARMLEYD